MSNGVHHWECKVVHSINALSFVVEATVPAEAQSSRLVPAVLQSTSIAKSLDGDRSHATWASMVGLILSDTLWLIEDDGQLSSWIHSQGGRCLCELFQSNCYSCCIEVDEATCAEEAVCHGF